MKKSTALFYLLGAAALLLTGCRGGETREVRLPPILNVTCGGKTDSVGAWSAYWEGGPEGTSFVACGDAPTDLYVREKLRSFSASPGDILVLSYAVVPEELKVRVTFDMPEEEWGVTLYEGKPSSSEVEIVLPENCGGVYEAFAHWDEGSCGEGSTSCGLAVVNQEREGEILLREPPYLAVECRGEKQVLWRGSYTWRWERDGQAEGVSSDSPHPLDVLEELPILVGAPGDRLTLTAVAQPDELSVYAYRVGDMAAPAQAKGIEVSLSGGNTLVLPENGTGTVYEVRGTWAMDTCGGSAYYAFYVQ